MHQRIKMEFQKIVNFISTNSDQNLPRFITKKCVEVYDQSENNYSPNKDQNISAKMMPILL